MVAARLAACLFPLVNKKPAVPRPRAIKILNLINLDQ